MSLVVHLLSSLYKLLCTEDIEAYPEPRQTSKMEDFAEIFIAVQKVYYRRSLGFEYVSFSIYAWDLNKTGN